jgi:gliding motility-associated-like protein
VLNFTATPNGGFAFNNWYVVYQTPQPSNTANPMNFTVTQSDTVYVYFDAIPTYNVVIQSFPATGGSVTVNGTNYTTFPSTVTVQQNTNLSFTANPNVGFTYSNWYVVYQNPLPSATSNPMNFNVTQNDTVYVYYNVIPPDSFNFVVDVKPNIFAGDVKVAGFTPPSYPYSFLFESGTNVDFEATGNTVNASSGSKTYAFDRYDFIYHTPTPNELQPIVFINVQYPDTVVAYFKVTEQNTDTLAQVLIPSGFSPDGDGANDNFNVFVLPKGVFFKEYNMQVFNRWGQKVFESNNQSYSWNGEFGEKKCDIGAYGYILTGKLTNGDEVKKSGTVTLIR